MNIFDKFLNSISYKFSKGYPDMNNEQDILIIESELKKLGLEAKMSQPNATSSTSEISNILQTLQKIGVRKEILDKVDSILSNYNSIQLKTFIDNFRKYTVNDLDKIYDIFAPDFFNIKAKGFGGGELMLLIGLKDSTSGGLSTKDIKINGEVYEVKELDISRQFNLGGDGSISGIPYLKNLLTFKSLLTLDVAESLDLTEEEKSIIFFTIEYYSKNEPKDGSEGFFKNLIPTCEILKKKLSTQKETPVKYISANNKKIAISDEDYDKLVPKAGSINIDLKDELEDTKLKINKLKRHPWVENPESILKELNQKLESYFDGVNYMILFNFPGSPKGKLLSSKEAKEMFKFGRITLNSLNAKLIKQPK
jgi:hypothetical protein